MRFRYGKRIIAAALVACMAGSLAGCGTQEVLITRYSGYLSKIAFKFGI